MYHRKLLLTAVILGLWMLCGCSGNTGNTEVPTAAVTSEVTPGSILQNLKDYDSIALKMSDPLTVLCHLKIYEGYPLPQIQ